MGRSQEEPLAVYECCHSNGTHPPITAREEEAWPGCRRGRRLREEPSYAVIATGRGGGGAWDGLGTHQISNQDAL